MARILIADPNPEPRRPVRRAGLRRRVALAVLVVLSAVPAAVNAAPADAATDQASSSGPAGTVRADEAWERGVTGQGVGVALIDTGVAPTGALRDAHARQLDVSGPGRTTDGHGHGTFLGGLIVGDEGPNGPLGIAPKAQLWSVKVADAVGHTSLEHVLAGIAAVREHAEELGIRVVVLAAGGTGGEIADPVEAALEQLWADGLVVVVASGNDGGVVAEPGVSPYLLTVGAVDDRIPGTLRTVAWSGSGHGRDGASKPDVLAPGASVVSVRAPGSVADRENPDARIDGHWFRGSGTSMAAAVAAGAAALVLDAHPDLTPDQVKGRLVASARPIDGNAAGVVDVLDAIDTAAPPANAHLPRLAPTGLDGSGGDFSWVGKSWVGKSWVDYQWQSASLGG